MSVISKFCQNKTIFSRFIVLKLSNNQNAVTLLHCKYVTRKNTELRIWPEECKNKSQLIKNCHIILSRLIVLKLSTNQSAWTLLKESKNSKALYFTWRILKYSPFTKLSIYDNSEQINCLQSNWDGLASNKVFWSSNNGAKN